MKGCDMSEHAKRQGIFKSAICVALALMVAAVVLAAAPNAAHAADLQAGAQTVSAQGGTVKVKVISGWSSKQGSYDNSTKISYLANGLIKEVVNSTRTTDGSNYSSKDKTKYTYAADKLVKTTFTNADGGAIVTNIKYDGDGRMKTVKNGYATSSYAYDSKGRVKSIESKGQYSTYSQEYAYDGDGLVKTRKGYSDGQLMQTDAYTYNKSGDLTKVKQSLKNFGPKTLTMTYKHTYESGAIAKTKITYKPATYSTVTLKYSYTTVNVPKSYAKAVKSQQRNLMQSQFRVFAASSIYPTQA